MLSVILCTYNRDKYIYNVLKSLAENTLPPDQYEIVLVDNNCTDNTRGECDRFVKDFPDVTFVMKNGTEYEHKGRVTTATGMVNATTGTIALKATFPNPDLNLYSGIQGSVVIPSEEKDVFVIPQVAVVKLQDKQLVYKVLADSTVTAIDVTTQDTGDGEHFIALTGLTEGDRIVTVGANNVQEGQRVLFPEVKEEQN